MSILPESLECFLTAGPEGRPQAFADLLAGLKSAIRAEFFEDAAATLRKAVVPGLDFTSAQALCRLPAKIRPRIAPAQTACRVAILSSFTADHLTQLIDLHLFAAGVEAKFYQSEFGTFRQTILDPMSELYTFKPQIVFIATSFRDLGHLPGIGDGRETVERKVADELSAWKALWSAVHERLKCQIIQNNFDAPPWRVLGNYESQAIGGLARFVARVNNALADEAPPYVTIHDLDNLAATFGRWNWGDERFFHLAKIPCAPECQVEYAAAVASLIAAHLGLAKKCLVLDLDNTLWGGVIGDDGLGGIRLGQGEPEGEAFLSFQRYVRGLMERGIILAVCSKNEEKNAREVFDKHPEMVLKSADIACFVANWTDKAANLRMIAQRLNIGLNALVFADDNPAERSIVRRLVPEVAVPELPTDPAGYVRAIEQYRYFQTTSLAAEDLNRARLYQTNAQREEAQSAIGDVDAFLESLEMTARIEPITAMSLERSAQLINKSNQFNLTTRRYAAAQVAAISEDPAWITRTVSLADRFGDNGLISVLLAKRDGDALWIDTWLMSCRVLKRGVEAALLNELAAAAGEMGVEKIVGEYIPTAKNGLVADHYEKLGFRRMADGPGGAVDAAGHTRWELALETFKPRPHFIKENLVHG